MMTVTENTANAMSQSIGKLLINETKIKYSLDYNNYSINRSYPATTYDYHLHNPWEKPNYATFHHQSPLFSTGNIPSMNKSYQPSFDTIPNLNNTNPNFYRRHSMLRQSTYSI